MRYSILFILLLFLFSCKNNKSSQNIDYKPTTLQKSSLENQCTIWVLSNYIDSIVENKAIAKYRLQRPSWFGILLEITADSIKSYGSIVEINDKIKANSDTLYTFSSFAGKWLLIKANQHLLLKEIPLNQHKLDTSTYIYRQRNDLKSLLKNFDKVHKISSNITTYFNQKIISGIYYDANTKETIEFKKDGSLKGLGKYKEYKVRNYFGTSHPYNNLDVIYLRKEGKKSFDHFHWKMEKNKLELTNFIFIEDYQKYDLGDHKIVLGIKDEI